MSAKAFDAFWCWAMSMHGLLLSVCITMRQRYIAISNRQPRHNAAGAVSRPDRADRARGGAPPSDARLPVAVARRGAHRRARAGASAGCSIGSPSRRRTRRCSTSSSGCGRAWRGRARSRCGCLPSCAGSRLCRSPTESAGGWRRSVPASRSRRSSPCTPARLLLAGGARVRGGRARVRGRVLLLRRRGRGPAGALGWAVASAVALGCHYFAIFPIAIEAAILLARRGRAALPALAGVGVVGLGLPRSCSSRSAAGTARTCPRASG